MLTDDTGSQWHRVRNDLSRAAVLGLLADPTVRVGVHAERRSLRWIPETDRERVWGEEIEPNFDEHAPVGGSAPDGGQLPLRGTLWRRRGSQMLVFDDFD